MSEGARADVIRTFAAAFGTCDVDAIVAAVTEDLVWEFNGEVAGEGREAFAERMRADLSTGRAELTIEELVEQGDTVVALNRGRFVPHGEGESLAFVSAEVYTFAGDRIARMRTYQPMT